MLRVFIRNSTQVVSYWILKFKDVKHIENYLENVSGYNWSN